MRGGIPSFCNELSVLHPGFGLGIVGAAGEPDAAEDHRHAGDVEQVQPLAEEGNREQARKRRRPLWPLAVQGVLPVYIGLQLLDHELLLGDGFLDEVADRHHTD